MAASDHPGWWLPTWRLIATKHLDLRKRHGLMLVVSLLTIGFPILYLGLRLLFHAIDPKSYGPAGSPSVFQGATDPMTAFGFIAAATLGATAGSTDLSAGMFRHLVITGRSRLALYLARIPAGLSIVLPLVGVAFAMLCLVVAFEGEPQPSSLNRNGVSIPLYLSQAQLESWLLRNPADAAQVLGGGPVLISPGGGVEQAEPAGPITPHFIRRNISQIYTAYIVDQGSQLNPPMNEMVKIGLWIELDVTIAFLVGLGLGSLLGQRTLATILMIVLEIIVTPILTAHVIPFFLNGQRLVVGVAMSQLRPALLATQASGGGRTIFGGRSLGIPPMPTWAMIAVIVGWMVGWTAIGAWRMMTRDA